MDCGDRTRAMNETTTTPVALGDDPLDQFISVADTQRLLMVKATLGFDAYCSHL